MFGIAIVPFFEHVSGRLAGDRSFFIELEYVRDVENRLHFIHLRNPLHTLAMDFLLAILVRRPRILSQ